MSASEVQLDFKRAARIGLDEAILCQGKTTDHLVTIIEQAFANNARFLLTRLAADAFAALPQNFRAQLDFDPVSRTAYLGQPAKPATDVHRIAVVAAGTSDAFVTREVERSIRWYGEPCTSIVDVGVAGLWRLMDKVELIRRHPVVVVVAGMDAALPTVLGGLIGSMIIGVPTSTGYGVATGGTTALHAMLASCAQGITVVNIDNGYGAACAALRAVRAIDALRALEHDTTLHAR